MKLIDGRKTQNYIIYSNGREVGQIYGRFKNVDELLNEWTKRLKNLGQSIPYGPYLVGVYPKNTLDNYGVNKGG